MFDSRLYHREYMRKYIKENKDKLNARRRYLRTSKEGKAAALYEKIKNSDITLEWIKEKINNKCELTGISFSYERQGNRAPKAPSIDRIDSLKDYSKENCQVILTWLNIAKQNMSNDIFKELLKEVQNAKIS